MKFKSDNQRKAVMAKLRQFPVNRLIASENELRSISRGVAPEVYTHVYRSDIVPVYARQQARQELVRRKSVRDSDGDNVPDNRDCDPKDPKKQGYEIVPMSIVVGNNKKIGHYFFSKNAKDFFSSKNESKGFKDIKTGNVYFVTSEQFKSPYGNKERMYTIRVQDRSGAVNTYGDFNKIKNRGDAIQRAKDLATGKIE